MPKRICNYVYSKFFCFFFTITSYNKVQRNVEDEPGNVKHFCFKITLSLFVLFYIICHILKIRKRKITEKLMPVL